MRLPSSGLADLIDGGALGSLEHRDHSGLFAGLTGSDCSMLNERWLQAQCLVARLGDDGLALDLSDEAALAQALGDFVFGPTLEGIWKPKDLALCLGQSMREDGVLGGGEFAGHGGSLR